MFTVHYCNFTLYQTGLQDHRGGKGPLFTPRQEAICANNAIRLRGMQSAVIKDENIFGNIETVSIAINWQCSGERKSA